MESDLRLGRSDEMHPVEIDVRKILEQIGLDKDLWPQEWRDTAEEKLSS